MWCVPAVGCNKLLSVGQHVDRLSVIAMISLIASYTVFRKKTPTHIFFHISMCNM